MNEPECAARRGDYGWRLLRRIAFGLIVLVVSLILASLNVPGAAIVATACILALVVLTYIGPWLGPRRRR